MLTAIDVTKPQRLRRAFLALGTAVGALCLADPALAACVIAPGGTGTVANPGPNSTVICTGTTAGINVATTSAGAQVQIEGGAQVNGNASTSEIYLDGGDNRVTVGNGATPGPAILTDTNIVVVGNNAGLYVEGGSLVDLSGNPLLQINVIGTNAALSVSGGSQVIVPRPIAIFGSNASFFLDATSTLSAAANFTGSSLIAGDSGSQTFYIEGTVETLGTSAIENIVIAGDGDDTILLTNGTRFTTGASATLTPTYMLNGNGGSDTLVLDNIFQALEFSSTGIELLAADGGIGGISRIGGSHEFQEVRVVRGQLDVIGEAALGVPGSTLNVLTDGRLRFFGTGSSALTQQITGAGVFDYAGGSNEFATGNTLAGQFIISGGAPLISNSAAFGSAQVVNNAAVVLRDVTITNVLAGNGNYIIDGAATTLGGTNRMTGTITVQSGRLLVTDVSHLASGQVPTPAAIVIGAQGSLNLDLQSTGTLENALSGTGTLNKTSGGGLTINRSNSAFSGQVNLLSGRISVSSSDPLGTGSIFFGGAIMDLDNTADIVLANAITSGASADAVFQKNGTGRVTLTGNNAGMTGAFLINQGVLAVNSVTALGTGGYASLGGGATVEVANVADETLGLRVTNIVPTVGTFRKLGTGRLTIANQFEVSLLAVDAGRVRVNQTITAASVNVASGASLDGTGRIIGNLTNNGTVAPGNSIGTLTVQGNYVHNSGSVLEIEFDANGNIDLLAVTGTATLNGGTLRFVSLGGAEGSGGTFLTATGGVTGTFANVQTVGAQLPLAVIYLPNSGIMAPSVLTARPSTFNAQFMAASDSAFGFIDRVAGSTQAPGSGKHLWMQGFAADGNRSAGGATLAYEHKGHGLAGGLVLPLGERLSVGASIGWSRSTIALGSSGGSGQQDAVLGSLHLRFGSDDLALEAGGFYGSVDQDTLRNVSFNGFSASVAGATKSKLYGGFIGGRAKLADLGGWKLSLGGRASLAHQSQDGFTELGTSPLRLSVAATGVETAEVQGGFGLDRQIGKARLSLNLGGRLVDNLGDRQMAVTFAASNAAVTLQGDARSGVHGYAGAALELPLSERVSVNLGYAGQVGQTDRHEGRAGLRVSF